MKKNFWKRPQTRIWTLQGEAEIKATTRERGGPRVARSPAAEVVDAPLGPSGSPRNLLLSD